MVARPKPPWQPHLLYRLLGLVVPPIIIAFIATWALSTSSVQSSMATMSGKHLHQGAQSLATGISNSLTDAYSDAVTTGRLYAAFEAIETGDPKNFQWYADELLRTKGKYVALVVTDAAGNIVATNTIDRRGRPLRASLLGRNILTTGWVEESLRMRDGRTLVVPVSRPDFLLDILPEDERVTGFALPLVDIVDEIVGTLAVLVSMNFISESLEGYLVHKEAGLESLAVVVNRAGYILAIPSGVSSLHRWYELKLPPPVVSQPGELQRWESPTNQPYYLSQRFVGGAIADWSWRLVTMNSVASVEAPATIVSRQLFLFFGLILTVTLMALVFQGRRFVRPIRELTSAVTSTRRVTDFKPVAVTSADELGALTSSFNALMEIIRDYEWTLEQRVEERTAELAQRTYELENALESLQSAQAQLIQSEKMASLGGLVAGVAHEINTPLGIGVTAASTMVDRTQALTTAFKEGKLGKSALTRYLDNMNDGGKLLMDNLMRSAQLIENFKQVSADRTNLDRREIELGDYIETVLASLSPQLRRTKHKITVDCSETIRITTYPGCVAQVLTNFLMNSILHGYEENESGKICIEVTSEDDFVRIDYSDDGRGIPEDIITKVFDPFFTTRRGAGGTGLGLNIVFNIVTGSLKGRVECSSEVGRGTTFTVELPYTLS